MARKLPARWMRWGLNLWPPYLGAGICVRHIASDYRSITVDMKLRLRNRNYFGTHFGGSLYAMTDPFFALMVFHNLPPGYVVWDKEASIEFVAPGRGLVSAQFHITDDDIAQILRMTDDGQKHLHLFKVDVVDAEQLTVARVEKIVYVRKKKEG